MRGIVGSAVLLLALLTSPAHAQPGPTQAELNAAATNAADWLHPNHDYAGQRYVEAAAITRENAGSLRPACRHEIGDLYTFYTSPIVYRGALFVTTTYATVALDAVTCRVRWRHDWVPKARESFPQSRGVALKASKVIRGTGDGYLLALDAETGKVLWERAAGDAAAGFTMAPVVFEDLVIIGPAGSEVPIKGWVGAFKLENGDPVWRFAVVPAPGEPGAETWSTTDVVTGGGAVWTPFSLDVARGLVYVATTNPAPDFFGDVRLGANLYTNCLVVLDARTGKLAWHYQAVPHDTHDWDLTQVSPLFSAEVKGKARDLVTVAGKDGLLRVLDRQTREHLWEVAVSRRENVDVPLTTEGVYVCPGPLGGVQWNGPAFSSRTNMLYVPSVNWCGTFYKAGTLRMERPYMGGVWSGDPAAQANGWLTAVDASTGAIRWRYESQQPMLAAVTVTSGDVLFTGELGGDFLVLDARTGAVLYRHPTGAAMSGGVVTYVIDGTQYVAVTSGSARFFWGVPRAPAAVTIFALPRPGS